MYSSKKANRLIMYMIILFTLAPYLISPIITNLVNNHQFNYTVIHQVIFSQWILIFIPIILYFIITGTPLKGTIVVKRLDWITILLVIALGFTIQPVVMLINLISQLFVENQIGNVLLDTMDMPYLLILFLFAMTPAIVEELLMRGVVLSNYRNTRLITTCLINGLFFGIFHMNINQFLYAFVLGIVFCFVVHVTESIYSTMIIHFIINGTNVTLLKLIYWSSDLLEEMSPGFMEQLEMSSQASVTSSDIGILLIVMIPVFLVGFVLTSLILWGLMKHHHKLHIIKENPLSYEVLNLPRSTAKESDQKVLTFSFIASILIFLLITLNSEFNLHFIEYILEAL